MGLFNLSFGGIKQDPSIKKKNEVIALLSKKHDVNVWNFISTQKGGIPDFAGMILNTFSQLVKNNPNKGLQQHYYELSLNMLGQAPEEVSSNKEMWSKWIVENGKNDFSLTFFFILFFIDEQVRQNSSLGFIHIQLYLDLIYSKAIFNDAIPHHWISQEDRYIAGFEAIQKERSAHATEHSVLFEELKKAAYKLYKIKVTPFFQSFFSYFDEIEFCNKWYNKELPDARKFVKDQMENFISSHEIDSTVVDQEDIAMIIEDAEKIVRSEFTENIAQGGSSFH